MSANPWPLPEVEHPALRIRKMLSACSAEIVRNSERIQAGANTEDILRSMAQVVLQLHRANQLLDEIPC